MIRLPPTPAPTPMPASAPVERPDDESEESVFPDAVPLPEDVEEDVLGEGGTVVVVGDAVFWAVVASAVCAAAPVDAAGASPGSMKTTLVGAFE